LVATLETTEWIMKIKLFNEITPITVNNFVIHSQDWYYDWVLFHRVIENFMIQWGDPTWNWMWGESIYGENFRDEFNENLSNIKYSISMANSWKNTNWSQFYINQVDNDFLNNRHTVFGQVIEWTDIVYKIAEKEVGNSDKPIEDIKILKITIEKFNGESLESFELNREEVIEEYNDLNNNILQF
jgi:cyclophilin family peptidyl-prolyl cis-trans isomerase